MEIPDYQGQGIAGTLVEMAKEKYKDYLYIEIMPEESKIEGMLKKASCRIITYKETLDIK